MCPYDETENCEITFCPWFLEYGMKRKYKTFSSWWKDKSAVTWAKLATLLDKWITNRYYTPIDLVSLFDKVILHEVSKLSITFFSPGKRVGVPADCICHY
jgi:hypothetical protein